jgi:GDP-L-fucose synthase
MKRILVTGGSGQLGRELRIIMPDAIFVSSADYDLTSQEETEAMIASIKPTHVIHTAAKVGGIIDNIKHQTEYYTDNLLMNTNVINSCLKHNVENFIGILSTCIYPDVANIYPMKEETMHDGPPTSTNFSYAIAKRSMATHIDSIRKQFGKNYCYVIPCNLFGVYDKFDDRSHFVASILKKINEAEANGKEDITLFGTGKALRQVLYATDLAKIINEMIVNDLYECFNVASPENLTISEFTSIALDATGLSHLKIKYDEEKPDGQYRKDVCIDKFRMLFPDFQFTSLNEGINEVYETVFKKNQSSI